MNPDTFFYIGTIIILYKVNITFLKVRLLLLQYYKNCDNYFVVTLLTLHGLQMLLT